MLQVYPELFVVVCSLIKLNWTWLARKQLLYVLLHNGELASYHHYALDKRFFYSKSLQRTHYLLYCFPYSNSCTLVVILSCEFLLWCVLLCCCIVFFLIIYKETQKHGR